MIKSPQDIVLLAMSIDYTSGGKFNISEFVKSNIPEARYKDFKFAVRQLAQGKLATFTGPVWSLADTKFTFQNSVISGKLSDAGVKYARELMKSWTKQEKLKDLLQFFVKQYENHQRNSGITLEELAREAMFGLIPKQECGVLCNQLVGAGDLLEFVSKEGSEYAYRSPQTSDSYYSGKYDDSVPSSTTVEREPAKAPSQATIYEKFIEEIESHGECLEETPQTYVDWQEPDFRNSFLPMLRKVSKMYSVTAETFNRLGKTDIIVKDINGKNLFVVECKLWSSYKPLKDGLSQLAGLYTRWTDERIVLMIFNTKDTAFTSVIGKAKQAISDHDIFISGPDSLSRRRFRYVVSLPLDPDARVQLELILFNFL